MDAAVFFRQAGAVLICTMLNLIDAVTYGRLTFPIHYPGFEDAEFIGIVMFLLSCSTAQLIISWMSSMEHGVTASAMVENLPFLHAICFQLASQRIHSHSTAIVACGLGTLMTAGAFGILAFTGLANSIHQFPRCVLVGSMGGIGAFLLQTGVSMAKGKAIWMTAFMIAVVVVVVERRHGVVPFMTPTVSGLITVGFYCVALTSNSSLDEWRRTGWLANGAIKGKFDMTLLGPVQWSLLPSVFPTMLAMAAFALLHVPINIPSYARTCGLPFDMQTELYAHAASNFIGALLGFLPNYFVYTNSVLFLRAGARGRGAGLALGMTTLLSLFFGLPLLAFIPVPVVMFLIFYLGLDLLFEALLASYKLATLAEYAIIWGVVLLMPTVGFVTGIAAGLFCALANVTWHHSGVPKEAAPIRCIHRSLHQEHRMRQAVILRFPSHRFFANSMRTTQQILDAASKNPRRLILVFEDGFDMNVLESLMSIWAFAPIPMRRIALVGYGQGRSLFPAGTCFDSVEEAILVQEEEADVEAALVEDQLKDPEVVFSRQETDITEPTFFLSSYALLMRGAVWNGACRFERGALLAPHTHYRTEGECSVRELDGDWSAMDAHSQINM